MDFQENYLYFCNNVIKTVYIYFFFVSFRKLQRTLEHSKLQQEFYKTKKFMNMDYPKVRVKEIHDYVCKRGSKHKFGFNKMTIRTINPPHLIDNIYLYTYV